MKHDKNEIELIFAPAIQGHGCICIMLHIPIKTGIAVVTGFFDENVFYLENE